MRVLLIEDDRATAQSIELTLKSESYNVFTTDLALQLPFCLDVSALSGGLVSPAPERPCDDMRGLNPLSRKSDGDAADFLD